MKTMMKSLKDQGHTLSGTQSTGTTDRRIISAGTRDPIG